MGTLFPSRLLIYFLLSSDDRWRGASARSSALPSKWLRFGCGWGWRKFPDSSRLVLGHRSAGCGRDTQVRRSIGDYLQGAPPRGAQRIVTEWPIVNSLDGDISATPGHDN